MQGFPDFTKIALPAADQITASLGEMPDAINPGAIDNAEQLPLPALASGDAETQARRQSTGHRAIFTWPLPQHVRHPPMDNQTICRLFHSRRIE